MTGTAFTILAMFFTPSLIIIYTSKYIFRPFHYLFTFLYQIYQINEPSTGEGSEVRGVGRQPALLELGISRAGHMLPWVRIQKLKSVLFLAVQNSSIGVLVTDSVTNSLTEDFTTWQKKSDPRDLWAILTLQSDPRGMWPFRHSISVKKLDLTNLTIFDNFIHFWQFL